MDCWTIFTGQLRRFFSHLEHFEIWTIFSGRPKRLLVVSHTLRFGRLDCGTIFTDQPNRLLAVSHTSDLDVWIVIQYLLVSLGDFLVILHSLRFGRLDCWTIFTDQSKSLFGCLIPIGILTIWISVQCYTMRELPVALLWYDGQNFREISTLEILMVRGCYWNFWRYRWYGDVIRISGNPWLPSIL